LPGEPNPSITYNKSSGRRKAKCPLSVRVLFLVLCFFLAPILHAQTFRVPFHSANGLILLDLKVNSKPRVMLLDTGAKVTLLRHAPANAVAVELEPSHAVTVSVLDLEKIGVHLAKRDMAAIDGLLGQAFLRYFASVRIDYKASVIEFEK